MATLLGIDGAHEHCDVSGNRGGCVVFFLVARFAILFTAGCTCTGLDMAIEFFNNIHERALLCSLFEREFML